MLWTEQVVERARGPHVVNDSKTPSGNAHVGSLRGPLIHDALVRTLRERGEAVRFLFGVDDYDPLDELPPGPQADVLRPYLGAPLCDVPVPPGSRASDLGMHFIGVFFEVLGELGLSAEHYRMRDVYRSGRFNECIDTILRHADVVREVYLQVSGSRREPDWYPFQAICEHCGRIGTTRVTAYDGREVAYTCEPALVTWAQGCGYAGRRSPFDGAGKLPWKLEWVAKWKEFGVTIEGAGKDHGSRGGSRDVAVRCMRRIFDREPPLDVPYEFFTVGGAKMSSSRGVGASARAIADLLPPELLRFLLLRALPKRPVDFEVVEEQLNRLFNDFDRLRQKVLSGEATADERRLYALADPATPLSVAWPLSRKGEQEILVHPQTLKEALSEPGFLPAFSLILILVQMPHLDPLAELEKLKGGPLTPAEQWLIGRRAATARTYLEHYAGPEQRIEIQTRLPEATRTLGAAERGALRRAARELQSCAWTSEAIQSALFDAARRTPIDYDAAFRALYTALLGRDSGPKAGNLLAFLERDFVVARLCEVSVDARELWKATATPPAELEAWLGAKAAEIQTVAITPCMDPAAPDESLGLELAIHGQDGRVHVRRLLADGETTPDSIGAIAKRLGFTAVTQPPVACDL
jgi:lysyl-tRNA synthetase, class I